MRPCHAKAVKRRHDTAMPCNRHLYYYIHESLSRNFRYKTVILKNTSILIKLNYNRRHIYCRLVRIALFESRLIQSPYCSVLAHYDRDKGRCDFVFSHTVWEFCLPTIDVLALPSFINLHVFRIVNLYCEWNIYNITFFF